MKIRRVLALVLAFSLIMTEAPAYGESVTDVALSQYGGVFDVENDVSGVDVSAGQRTDNEEAACIEDSEIFIDEDAGLNDISSGDGSLPGEEYAGEFSFEEAMGAPVPSRVMASGKNINSEAPEDIDYSLYYNQIGSIGKRIYEFLNENVDNFLNPQFKESVSIKDLGDYTASEVKTGFMEGYAAFDYDHPEIFWLNPNSFTYGSFKSSTTGYITRIEIKKNSSYDTFLHSPYSEDTSLIEIDKALMEEYVGEVVSDLENETSLEAVITEINDRLTLKNYYNRYVSRGYRSEALPTTWESFSALTDQVWMLSAEDYGDPGAPVCEAYSRAFKIIASRLGITSILVTGNNHMWNYVYDDEWGGWYGLDITWDDPVRFDEWIYRETPEGQIHQYILCGSDTFLMNHTANGSFWKGGTPFKIPELNENSYMDSHGVEDAIYWIEAVENPETVLLGTDESLYATSNLSEALNKANELSEGEPDKSVIIQMNQNHTFTDLELNAINENEKLSISLNGKNILFDGYSDLMTINIPIVDNSGALSLAVRGEVEFARDIHLSQGSRIDVLDGKVIFNNLDCGEDFDPGQEPLLNVGQDAVVNAIRLSGDIDKINIKLAGSARAEFYKQKNGYVLAPVRAAVFSENIETGTRVLLDKFITVQDAVKYINDINNASKSYSIGLFEDVFISGNLTLPTRANHISLLALDDEYSVHEDGFSLLISGNLSASTAVFLDGICVNATNVTASSDWDMRGAFLKAMGNVSIRSLYMENASLDVAGNLYITNLSSLSDNNTISFGSNISNVFKLTGEVGEEPALRPSEETVNPHAGDDSYSLNDETGMYEADSDGYIVLSAHAVTVSHKALRVESETGLDCVSTAEKYLSRGDKPVISGGDKATAFWFKVERNNPDDGSFLGTLCKRKGGLYYDLNAEGTVTLYKDGHFAGNFMGVQETLNEINRISSGNSDYIITINREETPDGMFRASYPDNNLSFPKAGKCSSLTIKSGDGFGKKLFYKDAITINGDVKFENIELVPKSTAGTKVKLGKSCLTLEGTGDSVFYSVSGTGTLSIQGEDTVTVNKDFTAGKLDLGENATLVTLSTASVGTVYAPRGTWKFSVKLSKNKSGEITGISPITSIGRDFDVTDGAGLSLVPVCDGTLPVGKVIKAAELSLAWSEEAKPLVNISHTGEEFIVKTGGYVAVTDKEPGVFVINGEGRGFETQDINEAFNEINLKSGKSIYSLELLKAGQILTTLPKASKAEAVYIDGNGGSLKAGKTLSWAMPLCLENIILETAYGLTFRDLTATGDVTLKNKVSAKGKSQINVKGSVTADNPIVIGLFKDKELSNPAPVGRTTDAVYSDVLLTVSKECGPEAFVLMGENLPAGADLFSPGNFLTAQGEYAYMISRIGNEIRVIFESGLEAVLVREDAIYDGNLSGHTGKIIGFYPNINEAFGEIDRIGDDTAVYSVVVRKDTAGRELVLPTKAREVIISGNSSMPNINVKGTIETGTSIIFSGVLLKGSSDIKLKVNSGTFELINRANVASGSKWGKIKLADGTKFRISEGSMGGSTYTFNGNIEGPGAVFRTYVGPVTFNKTVSLATLDIWAEFSLVKNNGTLKAGKVVLNKYAHFINNGIVTGSNLVVGGSATFENAGTVDAGVLEYTGEFGQYRTCGPSTLEGIKALTSQGILSYTYGTELNINGDIVTDLETGSVLLGMTGCPDAAALQVISGEDGKISFDESQKLVGIKGLYNESRVNFSVNGRSIDKKYLCISENAVYYSAVNNSVLPKLMVYTGEELSDRASMRMVNIKSASTLINSINRAEERYYLELPDENSYRIKNVKIIDKCVLPDEGKCAELVISCGGEEIKNVRFSSVSGSADVSWTRIRVVSEGAMKHTGNLKIIGGASLELKKESTLNDVYLGGGSFITALQGLTVNNMDGEDESFVNTRYKGSSYTGMTVLRVKGSWNETVKIKAYGYNVTSPTGQATPFTAFVRNSNGYVIEGSEDLCQMAIYNGDGEFLTYHKDLASAMQYIDATGNKNQEYLVKLRAETVSDGIFNVTDSKGKLTAISLPSKAKSITLVADSGEPVTVKNAGVTGKTLLKLVNITIDSSSAVSLSTLEVTGESRIWTDKAVKLGDINGDGRLVIKETTTKALRSKSSTQLTISGEIEAGTEVVIVPYEYINLKSTPVAVGAASAAALLVNGGESPKSYKKLAHISAADISGLSVCGADGSILQVDGTEVTPFVISGGLYISTEAPKASLEGYDALGNLVITGEYLTLAHALTAVDKINNKKLEYKVILKDTVGSVVAPVSVTLPGKTAKLTLDGDGHKIYISNAVSLKTATVLEDIEPVYVKKIKKKNTISAGTIKTGSRSLTLKGTMGNPGGLKITGESGSSLMVMPATGSEIELISSISGISDMEVVSGEMRLSENLSVSNLKLNGATLAARNVTVKNKLTLSSGELKAGNETVGTGKLTLKNVVIAGSGAYINGKQDKKGVSLINLSGTVTRVEGAPEDLKLTVGLYYNNSSSRYAQWYSGMTLMTASKADVNLLILHYTLPGQTGMGRECEGVTLSRNGKKLVIN